MQSLPGTVKLTSLGKATTVCIYMSFNVTNRRNGLQSVDHLLLKSSHINRQEAFQENR